MSSQRGILARAFWLASGVAAAVVPYALARAAMLPIPPAMWPRPTPAPAPAPAPASASAEAPGPLFAPVVAPESPAPPPMLPRVPEIIRRVDNQEMQVAITFDACATNTQANGFDVPVLRVLQREQVPATVFASGRWVEFHPAAMKELTAEPLIEFANHSYAHPHMGRLSAGAIGDELDRTEAALGRYGRQSVAFRPPFGDFNQLVLEVARERQLPAVLWDVVSGDPSTSATVEAMVRTVLRDTRAGSIVIFHINGRETKTATALPLILRQLRARGFELVHISTLLASRTAAASEPPLSVADDPRLPAPPPGDDAIMAPSGVDYE